MSSVLGQLHRHGEMQGRADERTEERGVDGQDLGRDVQLAHDG